MAEQNALSARHLVRRACERIETAKLEIDRLVHIPHRDWRDERALADAQHELLVLTDLRRHLERNNALH